MEQSTVYMTKHITPDALVNIYNALEWEPYGKVAVKVSTGEPPASNYLNPQLIAKLVQLVNGTIVECNTAYSGSRMDTEKHKKVAEDHGFTAIAPVDIQDEDGSMSLLVTGGTHLKENFVGTHFRNYGSYLVLSHFKGHAMAGFGGAIKNISIGLGSSEGKSWIHTGGKKKKGYIGNQKDFLESMGEAAKSVCDYLGHGRKIVFINVMNNLSVDCDCNGNPEKPEMDDIGILASHDPVALDQACVDLVFAQKETAGKALYERVMSRNGLLTLDHAEELGLGSKLYQIINIDGEDETVEELI